jgi:hypothetical protein
MTEFMVSQLGKPMNNNKAFDSCGRIKGGLCAILIAASVFKSGAQIYTISVANSSLQVNSTGGLSGWTINGVNQLANQSLFYSLGGLEYPINQLSAPPAPTFGGSSFGGVILNTNISQTYANSTLSVKTSYVLSQSGNGSSLASTFTVQNLSGITQSLQFYQLSDFTLGGVSSGQSVLFPGTSSPFAVTQTGSGMTLNGSLSGLGLGTSVTVEEMAGTSNFGLGNGNVAPNFGDSPLSANGNVEYAYEFEVTLPTNSSLIISELQAVPEPSSVALVSFGMLGFALLRRRGLVFFKK